VALDDDCQEATMHEAKVPEGRCECGEPVAAVRRMSHETHMRFHRPVDPAKLEQAQRRFLHVLFGEGAQR
jgi:hypothetical protein